MSRTIAPTRPTLTRVSDSSCGASGPVVKAIMFVMPVLAALGVNSGSIELFGGQLFAFRLLCLACLLAAISYNLSGRFRPGRTRVLQLWMLMAVTWFTWGCALVAINSTNAAAALPELFTVALGTSLPVALVLMRGSAMDALRVLRAGWLVAFLATGAVALWELRTGRHLPSAYLDQAGFVIARGVTLVSTFGNPNNYAAFLLLCAPFLVWGTAERGRLRLVYGGALIATIPLLLLLGSGVAFIGLCVESLAILLLLWLWHLGTIKVLTSLTLGVLALLFLTGGLFGESGNPVTRAGSQVAAASTQAVGSSRSFQARVNLTLNGIRYTAESWGLGFGPGTYSVRTHNGLGVYPTQGQVDPHDVWVEVSSEYGIPVVLMLLLFLTSCGVVGWRAHSLGDQFRWPALAVVVAVVGYLLAGLESSSFVKDSVGWAFLASLLVMSDGLERGAAGRGRIWSRGRAS